MFMILFIMRLYSAGNQKSVVFLDDLFASWRNMSVYCDSGGKLCGGIKRLFSNVVKKDTAATVIIDGVRLGRIHLI